MASGIGAAGSGAELTAEQVVATLIEPLLAQSVVLRAGPRMFTSSGGAPVVVPKIVEYPIGTGVGASATYWVPENTQIPEADPDYGELTLLPSSLRSIKILHRFSNELARLAVVNIAAALQNAIVRRVALAVDRAFLLGEGTNNTPTGLVNQAGIQSMAALTDLDDAHDAVGALLAVNAVPSAWLMAPADYVFLQKKKDTSGAYLLQPAATDATLYRLLGIPIYVTSQLPTGTTLLVDASEIAVARDVDASVKLLDQTYGDYDQLALRVVSRWDIGLLHAEAVVRLRD